MSARNRRLVISSRAAQDIEDIFTYSILNWGVEKAKSHRESIEARLLSLVETPEIGKPLRSTHLNLRVVEVEPHRVLYRLSATTIRILRVADHRRLLDQLIND
jgi:plasmid stabilization system protein ParE